MEIEVECYGASARWCGGKQVVKVNAGKGAVTVGAVLAVLANQYPDLSLHRATIAVAIDDEIVHDSRVVLNGQVLALIAPVSGG